MWRAAALLVLAAAAAFAQDGARLPFVDASGFVGPALRYSDVVAALGEPAQSRILQATRGEAEGVHRFGYPALGIAFEIAPADRPLADPPIDTLRVDAADGPATPQGVRVGLPEGQLDAVVAGALRVLRDERRGSRRTLIVSGREPHHDRLLRVDVEQGRVKAYAYLLKGRAADVTPVRRDVVSRRTERFLRESARLLALAAIVIVIAYVWRRLRRSGVISDAAVDGARTGGALVGGVASVGALVLGLVWLREGGWGVVLGGALALGGLLGAIVCAMLLRSRPRR